MNGFSIHDFLLTTETGLVGHRSDYNVREMAMGWYTRGVFTTEDVVEIEAAIQAQYVEPAEEAPEA